LAAALLGMMLAGGCDEGSRRSMPGDGPDDAPARSVEIPSGSASLPPSAGLAIPDTLDSGAAMPREVARPADAAGAAGAADAADAADAEAARRVVRDYYAAIAAGNYERAYGMWADGGRASGQTFLEFAAGFGATERVRVEAGTPGRVEGAAGSRYVEVPVTVEATTRAGRRQRFEGIYTLRRSVVDGATQEQQSWRISDAELAQVR
jgi:hypothetical protein